MKPNNGSLNRIFEREHSTNCICRCDVNTFLNHLPSVNPQPDAHSILLLDKIEDRQSINHETIRNHFIILASKFHPDKHDIESQTQCTVEMQLLNSAYSTLITDLRHNCGNSVIADKQSYTFINENNISCIFDSTFSIYSHKALVPIWTKLLASHFKTQTPKHLADGIQFTDTTKTVYVTVFNNGTIFCQGSTGLLFGLQSLATDIVDKVVAQSVHITCIPKNSSAKLRQSRKLFKKPARLEIHPALCVSSEAAGLASISSSGQSNLNSAPTASGHDQVTRSYPVNTDCTSTRQAASTDDALATDNVIAHHVQPSCQTCPALALELKAALKRIDDLEETIASIKNEQMQSSRNIDNIMKSQNQLVNTASSKLVPTLASSSCQSFVDIAATPSTHNNQPHNLPHSPPVQNSLSNPHKNESYSFKADHCLVIHNIAQQVKKDDEIRRAVGKCVKTAVIESIRRYGKHEPKYLVQFTKQEMRDVVIQNWSTDNFGSSNVRKPIKKSEVTKPAIGYAKHVPIDLNASQLNKIITEAYPGSTGVRMWKEGVPLKTVKISFSSQNQLKVAVDKGLLIDSHSLSVKIENATFLPRYTQCFRCWKFKHIAKWCNLSVTCRICSGQHEYINCNNRDSPRCRNCNGTHQANDWNKCEAFQKYQNEKMSKIHA